MLTLIRRGLIAASRRDEAAAWWRSGVSLAGGRQVPGF